MLEEQTKLVGTESLPFPTLPIMETTQQHLWSMGQEARLRALRYDGDPIEELHDILPEDLSAEEWQNIIAGAYD
jgi:hypothetical protein